MQDLTTILRESDLTALRSAYDPQQLVGANKTGVGQMYPRHAPWQATVGSLFYADSPLAPRDRELALIALLTQSSPGIALATHIYWGLMERLTVVQVCEVVGLTAAYCGMPTYTAGLVTLQRTLNVLRHRAESSERGPSDVWRALVAEFVSLQP